MSAVDTFIETESERVERWRTDELIRVGFDVEQATLIPLELAGDAYRRVLEGSMDRIVLAP